MRFIAKICLVLSAGLLMLLAVSTVFAYGIIIDGKFDDWVDKVSAVDNGGPDDERSPSRADINEFRADADSKGLYLLKTWDDTFFGGGQETTAGITLQMPNKNYYRIYTTAQSKLFPPVPLSSLNIQICSDASCKETKDVCQGAKCVGALAGSDTTWKDPFADIRKQAPDCSGRECGMYDTAVELYIPWELVGGVPALGETVFLNFGSYPSGPAQAPKDDVVYGIACQNFKDGWKCFLAKPTAVTLSSFRANTHIDTLDGKQWGLLICVIISGAIFWHLRKRQI